MSDRQQRTWTKAPSMHNGMRVVISIEQLEFWIEKMHGMAASLDINTDQQRAARAVLDEMNVVWAGNWVGGRS